MRHKVYGRHLNRDKNARTALFRNLVRSLILSEKIQTTESKAKAIKGLVDKLVTQAKSPTTRRLVSQFIVDKQVAEKLIKDIAPRLSERSSGYTSVVKLGRRLGDGAMMVQMQLLTKAATPAKEDKTAKKSESSKETQAIESSEVKPAAASEMKTARADQKSAPAKPRARKAAKK